MALAGARRLAVAAVPAVAGWERPLLQAQAVAGVLAVALALQLWLRPHPLRALNALDAAQLSVSLGSTMAALAGVGVWGVSAASAWALGVSVFVASGAVTL